MLKKLTTQWKRFKNLPWTPDSWQSKDYRQPIHYPDPSLAEAVLHYLKLLPPLVSPEEILELKAKLASACQGEALLVQGGDCTEQFIHCQTKLIEGKYQLLLQAGLLLNQATRKPIISIGRIAGQYSKPRSHPTEVHDNLTLPAYFGDLINDIEFTEQARQVNPKKMLMAYGCSLLTLTYLRVLPTLPGFSSMTLPPAYRQDNILPFLPTRHPLYTSHEALHLPYEQALTRKHCNQWFNLGTHFPWIGMRTAYVDSAHIEYCKGIQNPIALKVGSVMTPKALSYLIKQLNPQAEPGRLTLITRFGADRIQKDFPPLLKAAQETHTPVLWICDPMHGNTQLTKSGKKTRYLEDMLQEIQQFSTICQTYGTHFGGLHLEMTSELVTECLHLAQDEHALIQGYKSAVDPRLNKEQTLWIAQKTAELL